MPTRVMDQSSLSLFLRNPEASSLLAEEPFSSTERQVGFMKSDPRPDDYGARKETLISSNYSVSSPLGTHNILGAHSLESLGHCEQKIQKDQKAMLILERQLEPENSTHISTISKEANDCDSAIQPDLLSPSASSIVKLKDQSRSLYDNSSFSSSLSELFAKKLRLSSNNAAFYQSFDENKLNLGEEEPFESMEEIEAQTIGNLLPDDDDLLSGVIEDVGVVAGQTNGGDDVDDIFYCGGGMELETNDNRNACKASECFGGGASNCGQGTLDSIFAGEHPFGEHPSRTLFVRNINSNVEDAELRHLFEKYGDIRTMYTACKHRGFVMISYYDIRAARNAMQELQNKPLKRRKLDIHFSIPKENPSEKDINQGILMILNLDSSVSNDDLRRSFGAYGEIKEIREIPHKRHHKFIEFYDVRAAEAALRALNSSSISGKTIKLEPSHPGAVKRCLMQQLSPELELEELNGWKLGSPSHSQSDSFGSLSLGMITSSGVENGAFQNRHSMVSGSTCAFMESTYHGISSTVPKNLAATMRFASSGGHNNAVALSELSHSLKHIKFGFRGMDSLHPHSLPEYNNGVTKGIPFKTSNPVSAINPRHEAGIDKRIVHRLGSDSRSNHHDNKGNSIGFSGNGSCPLHERSYIWKNSHALQHQPPSPVLWSNISSFTSNVPAHTPPRAHGRPRGASHLSSNVLPLHHVGSAHQINHSLWDRRHGYHGDSIDPHAFHSGSLGSMGFSNSTQLSPIELASRGMLSHSSGNCVDPSISPGFQISSPQQRSQIFHCRNPMIPMPGSLDGSADRIKCRRNETNSNQPDNKKQYELDIEQIVRGEDSRTTLMIKNIPNKYTSKMLLAAIDENHRGTYDFIYLPIDFKNKCNVGYAFINMTKPQHIVPFYQSFSGKKWEKFNSEKVASLAYARIQGKAALITHFQNSSLMNEDKRCRPILFHSDGPNAGDQEPFPMGVNIRSRSARSKTTNGREEQHQGSPTASASTEASGNSSGSPSGSTLDSE